MTRGVSRRLFVPGRSSWGLREIAFGGGWSAAFALGLSLFLLSSSLVPATAAGQACTSYVVVSVFDRKTGADIKNLNAGDFQASLGKARADIVSATQEFDGRLLVLVQTDGMRNEKMEDVVSMATRLARQAPDGKPVAFGVFVQRAMFTKGFSTDANERGRAISEVAEEEPSLGKRVHLYDALHQALSAFGSRQPGDTVLLVTDGYDDGSDRSGSSVEKEYLSRGTRLIVMLRRTPSHVSGNFLWNPPEFQIHLMDAMSAVTGGTYTMFNARDFAFAWQGYMVGILLPERNKNAHKLKVQLQGAAAETFKRSNLYFPERLPPCSSAAPTTAAVR